MPRPDRWWEPFEVEWANMLSAQAWSIESDQPGLGLRLGGSMFGYWMLRGQVGEGITWLERLLVAGVDEPAAVRGRGALALGYLRWVAGNLDRSEALATEGRSLCEDVGDVIGVAVSCFLQGFVAEARGNFDRAMISLSRARDLYETANQASAAVAVSAHIGRIAARIGDFATARLLLSEAIPILERDDVGLWGAANAYGVLGLLVAVDGDVPQGALLVYKALQLHAALGDRLATLITLANAAEILAMSGRAEAATLLGASDTMREEAGPSVWTVACPTIERTTDLTRAFLTAPDFDAAFTAGQRQNTEQAMATARAALATITDEESSIP